MGDTRAAILERLKRAGEATIPGLAATLGLNVETIRGHLKVLAADGLVVRSGARKARPGRPEGLYRLTRSAEPLFPRLEGTILRDLAAYLVQGGHSALLRGFFEQHIAERRQQALARVRPLKGAARMREVARIFSELGFMAEVDDRGGSPHIRLCHCPIRDLVDATRIPCQVETGFLEELLAARPTLVSYIPAGGSACAYRASA